jgi:signal transduction histidine kinase
VLVAVAVALGAYPVVRRLTQRLESLQQGVERWGQGDLSTRLVVQGQDEVAFLAERFNAAAERVQGLVQVHKTLLANASHELRSPLTRIRLGLELMSQGQANASQRHEVLRNLDELDQLIGEILLASRLDATGAQDTQAWGDRDNVDLIGLAAELASQHGAELVLTEGLQSLEVMGHHRLLHRLLRNLLENAKRYGQAGGEGEAVELTLARRHAPGQDWAVLQVADRGPGVPQAERRRIFEPFYRLRGASEREGGVGLGLALVQSIAERHGGSVHCLAREGGGAVFEVLLPL